MSIAFSFRKEDVYGLYQEVEKRKISGNVNII